MSEFPRIADVESEVGNPKDIISRGKPGIHDIPLSALLHVGRVMRLGREKYGPCNWRGEAVRASVYIDAMFRHMAKFWDGESLDEESKESHLAHIAACCLIVLDAANCNQLIDDRPPVGPATEVIRHLTEAASE